MAGRVVHFEIPFDDGERARAFYSGAFGWQLMHMDDMDYTIVMTGPTDQETGPTEPGFINGGMFAREEGLTAPNVVIDVDDIDAALETVEKHGGKTVKDRLPVGDMGFAAYFQDSEGNLIGLWETASPS